jgi:hypothetical protein
MDPKEEQKSSLDPGNPQTKQGEDPDKVEEGMIKVSLNNPPSRN